MKIEDIKARLATLLATMADTKRLIAEQKVVIGKIAEIRSGSLSLIERIYSKESIFYSDLDVYTEASYIRARGPLTSILACEGLLKAIQLEIDGGLLTTVKEVIAAEIFSDFLEMASYLLAEGYKDPAAVMIGGVLEEHLRQLCNKNGIDSSVHKDGRDIPKTADRMNAELAGADVYSKLYQKGVTSWLDLRNKAAHGHYTEYDKMQVEIMEQSVLDFITKTS